MVKNRQMNTRVSPEAYQKLMQKCADEGCSTYEYLRQLVHDDVGVEVVPVEGPKQTELIENERSGARKIKILD